MPNVLIKSATVVNEGRSAVLDVYFKDGRIEQIAPAISPKERHETLVAEGLHLLPGCIDDQVHFREPGLTHKADLSTESRAAVAGGVTSYMEMPNTQPPALSRALLEEKYARASAVSAANYSFFMGTANNNADEVLRAAEDRKNICGVKIFMGSSTGAMLVDNYLTLDRIFGGADILIATHCEDEAIIRAAKEKYGDAATGHPEYHPLIRSEEACFESSFKAVQLAKKHGSRLHILHISTEEELRLFDNMRPLKDKRITAEVCVHHLHFTADDYEQLGTRIQCNPAIKAPHHRNALWAALLDDRLDIIATDHAPHTAEEKALPYPQSPSGLPLVQHSLTLMLNYARGGKLTIEKVAEKMAHAPAVCFEIEDRGFIREGYWADAVLVNLAAETTVSKQNILYKCGWSPLEGTTLGTRIEKTFVNGDMVWDGKNIVEGVRGQRLRFAR